MVDEEMSQWLRSLKPGDWVILDFTQEGKWPVSEDERFQHYQVRSVTMRTIDLGYSFIFRTSDGLIDRDHRRPENKDMPGFRIINPVGVVKVLADKHSLVIELGCFRWKDLPLEKLQEVAKFVGLKGPFL